MIEKEVNLHIDFNGQLDPSIFDENVYFKIVNLHKEHPIIQVNDYIFLGQYEDVLGTNVYYEEVNKNAEKEVNAFRQQAPISLKYLNKCNKILKLQSCKLSNSVHIPDSENVDLNFSEDYQTAMKKLKNGTLNIEDLIEKQSEVKSCENNQKESSPSSLNIINSIPPASSVDVIPSTSTQVAKEPKLVKVNEDLEYIRQLIKKPMKTKREVEQVDVVTVNRENLNYSVLKQLYLQNLHYKAIPLSIMNTKLHLYVDIENSIKKGIVNKKNFQCLSDQEKNKLISLENIENLAPPLQLALLVAQLKEEKKCLQRMSSDELKITDEYGRTPKERYRILKYLAKDIWYHIFLRYKDEDLMAKPN